MSRFQLSQVQEDQQQRYESQPEENRATSAMQATSWSSKVECNW